MKKEIVVGAVSKPSPEELLEMYEKFDRQSQEIRGQFRRGALTLRHVQDLIEHRDPFSCLFKVFKTIKLGTGLVTADDFCRALKKAGHRVDALANDLLGQRGFTAATEETEVDLVILTTAELTGKQEGGTTAEVFAGAKRFGLEKCPPEVGPQLRLQYPDQPLYEALLIGMEPIADSAGYLRVFRVDRFDGGSWLYGYCGGPGSVWRGRSRWVFLRRR